mmetsp:Transcript_5237/g.15452  ORF Transcript_5237/g.15452 Transcript_5237/m.15452 type:complete len:200 (+) Transcript_5237:1634-2233(+)
MAATPLIGRCQFGLRLGRSTLSDGSRAQPVLRQWHPVLPGCTDHFCANATAVRFLALAWSRSRHCWDLAKPVRSRTFGDRRWPAWQLHAVRTHSSLGRGASRRRSRWRCRTTRRLCGSPRWNSPGASMAGLRARRRGMRRSFAPQRAAAWAIPRRSCAGRPSGWPAAASAAATPSSPPALQTSSEGCGTTRSRCASRWW